jgi:hypothetical protein
MDVSHDQRILLISNELFQNVMKQYFAVFGIAVIALAMIGTTTTMTYAAESNLSTICSSFSPSEIDLSTNDNVYTEI